MTIDTTKTYTGTVSWFGGHGKSYGFIQPDDGSPSMFVHISAVGRAGLRELNEGNRLQYNVAIDQKNGKACAENLRIIQ